MKKGAGTRCEGSNQKPSRRYLVRWKTGGERIDGSCPCCGHLHSFKKGGELIIHQNHGCALEDQNPLISPTCPSRGRREVPGSMIVHEII